MCTYSRPVHFTFLGLDGDHKLGIPAWTTCSPTINSIRCSMTSDAEISSRGRAVENLSPSGEDVALEAGGRLDGRKTHLIATDDLFRFRLWLRLRRWRAKFLQKTTISISPPTGLETFIPFNARSTLPSEAGRSGLMVVAGGIISEVLTVGKKNITIRSNNPDA